MSRHLQKTFIVLCLITISLGRPLSEEDNSRRLAACGKSTENWQVTVKAAGSTCTGALVSPRHVLTSTHCVATEEKGVWKSNSLNYKLKVDECDENSNVIVHEVLASKVTVEVKNSTIGRARYLFLFGFCRTAQEGYLYEFADDLMVIEFAEDVRLTPHLQPVCFARDTEDHPTDASVDFYGLANATELKTHRVKVVNENKKGTSKRVDERLFLTTAAEDCKTGGLAARKIDGRITVVGAQIKNGCETKEKGGWEVYESVGYHSEHICSYTGACNPPREINGSARTTVLFAAFLVIVWFQ